MYFLLESEAIDSVEGSNPFCTLFEVYEWSNILFIKGHVQVHEIGDLFDGVVIFWMNKMCADEYLLLVAG